MKCAIWDPDKKGSITPKVGWISLRLKEMHIYSCTVEGAAQTTLSDVLPFWTTEEYDAKMTNMMFS